MTNKYFYFKKILHNYYIVSILTNTISTMYEIFLSSTYELKLNRLRTIRVFKGNSQLYVFLLAFHDFLVEQPQIL